LENILANLNIGHLLLWFIVLVFSLSFHEAAHAWTSERFGDYTGRYQGRITLNPLAHIDPVGTVLFPIAGAITGFPLLGWAKPVQTNPLLWRDKTRANISVSAAGPISNFILMTVAFFIIKAMMMGGILRLQGGTIYTVFVPAPGQPGFMEPIAVILSVLLFLNLALGVFNLIPIPPLDGSHVLESVLPYEMAEAYAQIRPYGFLLLLLLLWTPVLGWIFNPLANILIMLIQT
jgi:Zn-dependent protease